MVNGLDMVRRYFQGYENQYVIIGGMACDLLFTDASLEFRPTKDLDMILIVEALSNEFVAAFWQFVHDGGYEARQNREGKPEFFRFEKPTSSEYPEMIELFSRPQSGVVLQYPGHLMPLHFEEDELSSLSAILLNESYYRFIQQGMTIAGKLSVLDAAHIIPLKMKALLDLRRQKAEGVMVKDRDLRKHRLDVFRLYALLSADKVIVPQEVMDDIRVFVDQVRTEEVGLKAAHIQGDKDTILNAFLNIYEAEDFSQVE